MIIKKKLNKFPFINLIKKLLSRSIFFIGTVSIIIIIILTFYYLNSGMYERYKPLSALKKVDQFLVSKYFGFSFFKIDDYVRDMSKSLKYIIFDNDLENITIKINQKNLYNLELQRSNKLKGL